jgi:hypothetical protein
MFFAGVKTGIIHMLLVCMPQAKGRFFRGKGMIFVRVPNLYKDHALTIKDFAGR